tara:strand:+ start:6960 stop:7133 length:174 start_codon:yes stop_codon:yes gene_type:complete
MNVNNSKTFFQKIYLDEAGNMVIQLDDKVGISEKGENQYKTFKKMQLTTEGYLKTSK